MKFDTKALHLGSRPVSDELVTPVFHSSTYELTEGTAYEDIRYSRLSNSPNHQVLHDRLSGLMATEDAVVTGSGMAAISLVLETLLGVDDTIFVAKTVYGGTAGLLRLLEKEKGLNVRMFDATSPESWGELDTSAASMIYAETIANPTMAVTNLEALAAFARERGLVSVVDSTFASPVLVRPAEFGIDLVIHSATKYLNGHSDVAAGVVGGRVDAIGGLRKRLAYSGAMLDPGACYLLERGMKTLGVRVRQQSASAERLAWALVEREGIETVYYPLLGESEASAQLALGGGMFAFELPQDADVDAFFRSLRYFTYAPSLGGVESLIIRPARASHAGMSPAERAAMGVTDNLVRVSVGLEDCDDLLDDLNGALEASL